MDKFIINKVEIYNSRGWYLFMELNSNKLALLTELGTELLKFKLLTTWAENIAIDNKTKLINIELWLKSSLEVVWIAKVNSGIT